MLKHEFSHRRRGGFAAAALVAGMVLVPAGTAMAVERGAAQPTTSEEGSKPAKLSIAELRTLVDDLSLANETLEADNSTLQQTVDTLTTERDRLAQSISRFDDLDGPLESDRRLLLELRKALPETRPEAEAQLARIRSLALASDPQGLGRLIERVDASLPAFLDWRFGQYASSEEFSAAYVETGANAFDASFEAFRSGALLSVANRLDGLLTILDRAR